MTKNADLIQTYQEGDCLAFQLSSGEYGGIIVCHIHSYRDKHKYFLMITNLRKNVVPNLDDFLKSKTFGRKFKNFVDDVLIVWGGKVESFEDRMHLIGNIPLDKQAFRIGAYRNQASFSEFEESVMKAAYIDYQERNPYPIVSLRKKS